MSREPRVRWPIAECVVVSWRRHSTVVNCCSGLTKDGGRRRMKHAAHDTGGSRKSCHHPCSVVCDALASMPQTPTCCSLAMSYGRLTTAVMFFTTAEFQDITREL